MPTAYLEHHDTARPHRGINLDVAAPAGMATITTLAVAGCGEQGEVRGGLIRGGYNGAA